MQRKTKRVINLWIFRCKVTAFFIIFLLKCNQNFSLYFIDSLFCYI